MKKRASLILMILLVLALAVTLAACDPADNNDDGKTSYTLSFHMNGVGEDMTVVAERGEDISAKLPNLSDNQNYYFGGWYRDAEFTQAADLPESMPGGDRSYWAKWLVHYSVSAYLQPLSLSHELADYEKSSAGSSVYSAVKGESVTLASSQVPKIEGFLPTNATLSFELAKKDNDIKLYYDRVAVNVSYDHNLGDEAVKGFMPSRTLYFGQTFKVEENAYVATGHRFNGWALSAAGGSPDDLIDPDDELTVGATDIVLYAQWSDPDYTDAFGSEDCVFYADGKLIYVRGGREFDVTADPTDETKFTVKIGEGTLKGKFDFRRAMFALFREDMQGEFKYYDYNLEAVDDAETLTLDGYFGATYVGNGQSVSGFYLDYYGAYAFIPDDGDSGFVFDLDEAQNKNVFLMMGEETGEFLQINPFDSVREGYQDDFLLYLDGFGAATWIDTYHKEYYYGTYRVEKAYSSGSRVSGHKIALSIVNDDGFIFGSNDDETKGKEVKFNVYTLSGYFNNPVFYKEVTDAMGEYTGDSGTLTLDGFGFWDDSAKYVDGEGTEHLGNYTTRHSYIFGLYVEVELDADKPANQRLRFAATLKNDDMSFSLLPEGFEEYLHIYQDPERADGHPLYSDPILVLYSAEFAAADAPEGVEVPNGAKVADLYARLDAEGAPQRVATGFYTAESFVRANDGQQMFCYTFVRTGVLAQGISERDLFSVAVVVGLITLSDNAEPYECYYIYEKEGEAQFTVYNEIENGKLTGGKLYALNDGGGALEFSSIYVDAEGNVLQGRFSCGESEFSSALGESTDVKYGSFMINERNGFNVKVSGSMMLTFERVDQFPSGYHEVNDVYMYSGDTSLILAANGVAAYRTYSQEGTSDSVLVGTVVGTYRESGQTPFGDTIYLFTPNQGQSGESFAFVLQKDYAYGGFTIPSYHRYYGDNDKYSVSYELTGGGSLILDGFWFKGCYVAPNGVRYEGLCQYEDENKDMLWLEVTDAADSSDVGKSIFIEIGAKGYTRLDDAYGSYTLVDWNLFDYDVTVTMDGKGGLTMTSYVGAIVATGSYSLVNSETNEYRLALTADGKGASVQVMLAQTSSEDLCIVCGQDTMGLYISDAMEMLYFDGYNAASWYVNPYGYSYVAGLYLFDESFGLLQLYYNGVVREYITFTYDATKRTFKHYTLDSSLYGVYFTEDMSSRIGIGEIVEFDDLPAYGIFREDTLYCYTEDDNKLVARRLVLSQNGLTRYDEDNVAKEYKKTESENFSFENGKNTLAFDYSEIQLDVGRSDEYGHYHGPAKLNGHDCYISEYRGYDDAGALSEKRFFITYTGEAPDFHYVYFEVEFSLTDNTFSFKEGREYNNGEMTLVLSEGYANEMQNHSFALLLKEDGSFVFGKLEAAEDGKQTFTGSSEQYEAQVKLNEDGSFTIE